VAIKEVIIYLRPKRIVFLYIDLINKYINKKNLFYSKEILLGIISKLYSIQGTSITKAITIGNNIVQQKDIN